MTHPLLEFVEDPGTGKLASVGLGPLGDGQGGLQNRKPFRPLFSKGRDCSKRLLLIQQIALIAS